LWQRLSYFTIGTYYFVGVTQFFFTVIPFLFFLTGILPAQMSFVSFLIHGSLVAFFGVTIYLYIQKWMCHPETERGLHWRGTVLKYACWPVFFLGFLLAIVDADIPYIPTAKKAVTGSITPFARPLLIHVFFFTAAISFVFIYRRFFIPEAELVLSTEKTWAMIGFASIAFIMSLGGLRAAWEAKNLKEDEPWAHVQLNKIKTENEN
ncbi:MAG TPA: hypothetical protein VKQ08_05340, partial [Cyclobacteriaceae bacterium]|nr:hypothetical protein [Cyclobacteriaceae bacterium]